MTLTQEKIMSKEIISTENAPAAIGPYSQAVKAGGFVFLSGQIPIDPGTGKLAVGDIARQTRQVLKNIEQVLAVCGCDFSDVVKTTIFLTDMNDFSTVNGVYGEYFQDSPPARATVQVTRLPKNVGIEIEAVACCSG